MNVESIITGPFEEICYIVWNGVQQALVFDPGYDADRILDKLNQLELTVAAYVCTHGHLDHINALADLHDVREAPVLMHSLDLEWAFESVNQMEPHYPVPRRPQVEQFLLLETLADWQFADLSFSCMETPGHTPGSCSLFFPEAKVLIAGDTLFKGSCGRTDLPGGNPRRMKESLALLKGLPDETRVYPGHGPDTTIGLERTTNYFMQ